MIDEFENEHMIDKYVDQIFNKLKIYDNETHFIDFKQSKYYDLLFNILGMSPGSVYDKITQDIKGMDTINWNMINIIDELGSGYNGTTYRILINGFSDYYALKRQKITEKEYESKYNEDYQINNEINFFHWLSTLSLDDNIFFMLMYDYRRYECNFDSKSIKGTLSDELINSPYCQDIVVQMKGQGLNKLIDSMNRNEILSIFCQLTYGISLMNKSGYYHTDSRAENVCILKTSRDTLNIGPGHLIKVKTHGNQASLIDYGNVINERKLPENITKDMIDSYKNLNGDTWHLIDTILLNNGYMYNQISPNKTGFRSKELYDIVKIMNHDFTKVYMNVVKMLDDGQYLDDIIKSDKTFDDVKNDPRFKTQGFYFVRNVHVYYPNKFTKVLTKYFNKNIVLSRVVEHDLIKIIVNNLSDPLTIIDIISSRI